VTLKQRGFTQGRCHGSCGSLRLMQNSKDLPRHLLNMPAALDYD
jgi:hypothetical protein